jgi:hypothetical protein
MRVLLDGVSGGDGALVVSAPVRADRLARYTELIEAELETMEELSLRIAEGESLAKICKEWDVPYGRFAAWIADDPSRKELLEGAMSIYTDTLAYEALEIADTPEEGERVKTTDAGTEVVREDMLGHRKLKVDTRMRLMAKWNRSRYGDSVQVEHTGETVLQLSFGVPITHVTTPALVGSSSTVANPDDDL